MLVRFTKKFLTSSEGNLSLDEMRRAEFSDRNGEPDLFLSVYELEPAEVIPCYAQRATGFNPPTTAGALDVDGFHNVIVKTSGKSTFRLAESSHRELVFQNVKELDTFIGALMCAPTTRFQIVKGSQVKEYVRGRLAEGDSEWLPFVGRVTWVTKLAPPPSRP